ncbi:MAG TPA: hypothetical protein GX696_12075 [Pseudomonadaceae bacterium]|nr:hypothetical protein [Pseudomonadaceae bacterium]
MSAAVLTSTLGMDRAEWLEARKRGIGGSDAAAIAGLSKWRSPMAVYLDKIGALEPEEAGEAALWGTKLEDLVAREFSERTGYRVQRRNAILQHPDYPFMLANIDRYVFTPEGRALLECKTTSAYNADAWADDRIPDEYVLQVQHYLAVTGLQTGYIAVLIGGQRYSHKRIERDEEIIKYLIQIESDFWRLVENRTPPEMDGSDSSAQVLSLLYPESVPDSSIELPGEAELLIAEYEAAQQDEKAAAERKNEAANKLKALLGDYETGIVAERRVSWKTVSSSRLDTKALKKDKPDIYEQYARESVSRRFAIK